MKRVMAATTAIALVGITGAPAWGAANDPGSVAAHAAARQVGDPYVWGATGPEAFDCSGLINYAYGRAGIDMPRTVSQMRNMPGKRVSRSDLESGDLVFTSRHHVGVYTDTGKIVHAPSPGRNVTEVGIWNFEKAIRPRVSSRLRGDINNVYRSELDGPSPVMSDIDNVFKGEIRPNQVGLIELNQYAQGDIDHVHQTEIVEGGVSGSRGPGVSEIEEGTVTGTELSPRLKETVATVEQLKQQVADLQKRVAELEENKP